MKTLVFSDAALSTTIKLSYCPASPIWTSLMMSEQSPASRFSTSWTSSRCSNSGASYLSGPHCSSTVSTWFSHCMW